MAYFGAAQPARRRSGRSAGTTKGTTGNGQGGNTRSDNTGGKTD